MMKKIASIPEWVIVTTGKTKEKIKFGQWCCLYFCYSILLVLLFCAGRSAELNKAERGQMVVAISIWLIISLSPWILIINLFAS